MLLFELIDVHTDVFFNSDIKKLIKDEITALQSKFPDFLPGLAIVQVIAIVLMLPNNVLYNI